MSNRWSKTKNIIKRNIRKFGREYKKNPVDFLHESDVQAHLYHLLKKKLIYRVRTTSTREDDDAYKSACIHTEVHAKGWGSSSTGKVQKSDVLDIVVVPKDGCLYLQKPKKPNHKFGAHAFYKARLDKREDCFGIEIKYNRYNLKNKKRGVGRYAYWKRGIINDLRKLSRFRRGFFIFVSNIVLPRETVKRLNGDYRDFVSRKKGKPGEWRNIDFFYCDPGGMEQFR